MRRNQIEEILIVQTKRRNTIIGFITLIVLISILSFTFLYIYLQNNKNNYVTYSEKSGIEYRVLLKKNEFFENSYLESNKQYIASLIDKIIANFNYDLEFDTDNVEYKYEYRIDANVNVYDKDTDKIIFSKTENLSPQKEYFTTERNVSINKSVSIDYNHFNNLIKRFVTVYELEDVESVLTIDMYVNTIGSCEEFENNKENESVITLSIPLTTKTVAIEMSNDLIDTENNVMLCETNQLNYIALLLSILAFIVDIFMIIYTIKYEIKTRSADTIYIKKLKKILNNYGGYIQEIADDFNLGGYQVIKIKTFEDLIEIRDTIKQPILMKQNKEKTNSYFVVPSASKCLYIYRLKLENVE